MFFRFFLRQWENLLLFCGKKVKATAIYFELRQLWLGSVISQERKFIWLQKKNVYDPRSVQLKQIL